MIIAKRLRILAVLLVLAALPIRGEQAVSSPPGTREEQEKALVEFEKQRSRAIWNLDFETLDRIYAEDFRGLVSGGRFLDKTAVFEMFKGHDPSIRFSVDDLSARVLGSTAVTHGKITGRNPKGEVVLLSWFTHVLDWRDGRWQVVEGATTPGNPG
ncbi:MAG TPA: nuclear transport factor 2 family protein [Thermoanaerobaculia bacterium]|nr:nuclear transport factor 2 family protein [Thermoanaerobaculia bacterium]